MEFIGKTIGFVGKVLLFALVSLLFLPSFVIVNLLQKPWEEMLAELF
jgi:hypothetical protein